MDSGAEFFLMSLMGIFFGTLGLGAYMYFAYRLGLWLGHRAPPTRSISRGLALIAACCQPISLWPFLTDWDAFLKVGIALAFYVLNAFPISVAYGSAVELQREHAKRRFRKNVDDWLGEWECEPAHHSLDDED